MQKKGLLVLGLLVAAVGACAETFSLTYRDYPAIRTLCDGVRFEPGEEVLLSKGVPEQDGMEFEGWRYRGRVYKPGSVFTMPYSDVELVAQWKRNEAVETVSAEPGARKIIRDGRLLIVRDGSTYNIIGTRMDN